MTTDRRSTPPGMTKKNRAKLATIHARNLLRESRFAVTSTPSDVKHLQYAYEKMWDAIDHLIGAVEDLADAPEGS